MFIDIHVHTRKRPGPPRVNGEQAYHTPEQLIARFDNLDIESAVILPGVSPECSKGPQSVMEVLEICDEFPGRFIPFCNIDPRNILNSSDAPLTHLLEFYRGKGCRGIGEFIPNMSFLDPMVKNVFKCAEKAGLPLTFHMAAQIGGTYGLYDDPGLPQLERSLCCFPDLIFIAHSTTFWAEISRLKTPADRYVYPSYPVEDEGAVPVLMRRYPNIYGDLSAISGFNALNRDREYGIKFLNEFQDRLMFGTDLTALETPTPLVDYLKELKDAGDISEDVFKKVARDNAVRLLNPDL